MTGETVNFICIVYLSRAAHKSDLSLRHPLHAIRMLTEPGIRRGNEDSRRNENGKLWKKIDKHTSFSRKIKMVDL